MLKSVQKRDGRIVDFNQANIVSAITKAGQATGEFDIKTASRLSKSVAKHLEERYAGSKKKRSDGFRSYSASHRKGDHYDSPRCS